MVGFLFGKQFDGDPQNQDAANKLDEAHLKQLGGEKRKDNSHHHRSARAPRQFQYGAVWAEATSLPWR